MAGLTALSVILAMANGLMLVVATFRVSPAWGVATLAVPPIGLIFALTHWDNDRIRELFIRQIVFVLVYVLLAVPTLLLVTRAIRAQEQQSPESAAASQEVARACAANLKLVRAALEQYCRDDPAFKLEKRPEGHPIDNIMSLLVTKKYLRAPVACPTYDRYRIMVIDEKARNYQIRCLTHGPP